MEILTLLATGTLCCVCFIIGVKTAQTVQKGKDIELPNLNPLKAIREHQEFKETQKEQDKLETIMKNIEAYDGTSNKQEDIPR